MMPLSETTQTYNLSNMPFLHRLLDGGLPEGKLIGLVGPSGGGKTLLALQIAFNAAYDPALQTLYLYLDPNDRINKRIHNLTKELDLDEGIRQLIPAAIQEKTLKTLHPPRLTVSDIPDIVESMEKKPILIVVDQLMLLTQNEAAPMNRIKDCCSALKQYARQSSITILLLHQRKAVLTEKPVTRLSTDADAADTSSWEELVDIGLFIGEMDDKNLGFISRPTTEQHEQVWLDGEHNRFRDAGYRKIYSAKTGGLDWEGVYTFLLPMIVEDYKVIYENLRNDPFPILTQGTQQPYKLDTARYNDSFWEEVFWEHFHHGGSFTDTWDLLAGFHGCGAAPWPDMMRRSPKIFNEQDLYPVSRSVHMGSFNYQYSDADIQEIINDPEHKAHSESSDETTRLLAMLMTPERWSELQDVDTLRDIAHYLETLLSKNAARELEKKLGRYLKPFFDWIATGPSRDPRP